MGVQGLWELLAPVGRRVSVETLAGKRLAIDASIWMVQFIKAMRDEKGDMVQNAHLIGFFRRICKLLFLRTKPVFVFDGGTPALKRRTVIARRRQRENAQTKIRKTAEKLLLNRLKDMKLKEQTKDLKNQRLQQNNSDKEKKLASSESVQEPSKDDAGGSNFQEETLDEISPASMVGENATDDAIKGFRKYDPKGKGILLDGDDLDNKAKSNLEQDSSVQAKDYQEKLDEMLAASLAAEEDGNFISKASTSAAGISSEEEGSEEDEQMLLPVMNGNVDPAVLASLPPSMQLDLLVQMRERLMAENRQKYQKVKKAPEKFSELQIEAYLKTVAFRREINEVQRSAGGRTVGGVQTSRIASEANREFIFSSSFSGDKEVLASAREGRNDENQTNMSRQSLPVPVKKVPGLNKSDATVELDRDESTNPDENIEVYIDERGRLRIRNRHMGIQMTRDIQRNLHLMKEKEKTKWLKTQVDYGDTSYPVWFRELIQGPLGKVTSSPMYFTRGYVFHTFERGKNRATANYGVVVRAGDTDFYGIIQDIVQVQFPGLVNLKCTLLKCEWFDPVVGRGIRVGKFGVIDVNGSRSYAKYDPFVLASQADQVCFIPYPRVRKTGISWLSVLKIAPRGMIVESDDAPMQYEAAVDLTTPEQEIDNIILIDPPNREAEILSEATDAENPEDEFANESDENTDENDEDSNDDSE